MSRRLLDYGSAAVLLECADLDEAIGLLALVREHPKIMEVIPGARTLLLRLRAPLTESDRRNLLTLLAAPPAKLAAPPIVIKVDYSGPDLDTVARHLDCTTEDVVALHTGQAWTVGFCGFAPGFAYLRGEHDRLRVPRLASPRTAVPAGAVGLADQWSGIYPRSGPGGWQLIGRTEATLWNLDHDPPALLQPGGRVRFVALASR
jgi:KipI family sensor histidine kinase inhibitor